MSTPPQPATEPTVQRYRVTNMRDEGYIEDSRGDFVEYDDYLALLAKLTATEALLESARADQFKAEGSRSADTVLLIEQRTKASIAEQERDAALTRTERAEKLLEREADTARRMAAGAVESCPQEMREWFQRKADRIQAHLAASRSDDLSSTRATTKQESNHEQ